MLYDLEVATEPAAEPLSVTDAKLYARVDFTTEDAVIERQIAAGRVLAETKTRRAFITTTFDLWLESWPSRIVLPRPVCQSVTYVKYRDSDGEWQTVSSSVYEVLTARKPAQVVLAYGQTWPSIITRPNAVNVRYVAGYGDASTDVPAGIIEAIAAYVCSLYDERGVQVVGVKGSKLPFSAESLLDAYVVRDYALTSGGA